MTGQQMPNDAAYGRPAPDAFDLPRALAERERRARQAAERSAKTELLTIEADTGTLPQRFEPQSTVATPSR